MKAVSKNEAQTTKHAEGIYRPTGLAKDFFILENTIFQEKIRKLKTVFFFGDYLFLHQFFPMNMVISKKKRSAVSRVALRSAELNASVDGSISILVGLVFEYRL